MKELKLDEGYAERVAQLMICQVKTRLHEFNEENGVFEFVEELEFTKADWGRYLSMEIRAFNDIQYISQNYVLFEDDWQGGLFLVSIERV